ncbi:MAG: hypothetical protein U0941_02345 [Planctomycetaceae bacterium]
MFWLIGLYLAFLLWHEPWFTRRLRPGEALTRLSGKYAQMVQDEKDRFEAFMDSDDGRPFYMVNLMQYRDKAQYREGDQVTENTTGLTGREAGRFYNRAVIPALLWRGCYPVFASRKIANLFSAGAGTDFFEDVVIVRYRSRRDMLNMISSPRFLKGIPHKWASLEKTVVVPSRLVLLFDLRVIVTLVLMSVYVLVSVASSFSSQAT